MSTEAELPKYVCHKQVHALKINAVVAMQGGGARLFPAEPGYAPLDVSQAWVEKHAPQEGGYYVVYEDGYKSFSPAKPFEQGYTRV